MTICVQQVDIKYQDIWAGLASQESQIRTHTVADIGIDQNGNYIYQMLPDPQTGNREAWQMPPRGLQVDTFRIKDFGPRLRSGTADYSKPGFSTNEWRAGTQVAVQN